MLEQEIAPRTTDPVLEKVVMACGAEVVGPEVRCGLDELEREVSQMDPEDRARAASEGRISVCTNFLVRGLCPHTATVNSRSSKSAPYSVRK